MSKLSAWPLLTDSAIQVVSACHGAFAFAWEVFYSVPRRPVKNRRVSADNFFRWCWSRLRGRRHVGGPHLPALLQLLTGGTEGFPTHGAVALEAEGSAWRERWRVILPADA